MCKGTTKSTNDLRSVALDIYSDIIPKQWKVYSTIDLTITELFIR